MYRISAIEAMEHSCSHDEIVHIYGSVGAHADLLQDCDDYTSYTDDDGVKITEYWGGDAPECLEEGESRRTWRVHVHG